MKGVFLSIEGGLLDTHSRYQLAILAAQRARQLTEGDRSTVPSRHVKPTSIGIEEMLRGNLEVVYGKEARRCQDELQRSRHARKARFLSPEREEALQREIKKDLNVYFSEPMEKEYTATEETVLSGVEE